MKKIFIVCFIFLMSFFSYSTNEQEFKKKFNDYEITYSNNNMILNSKKKSDKITIKTIGREDLAIIQGAGEVVKLQEKGYHIISERGNSIALERGNNYASITATGGTLIVIYANSKTDLATGMVTSLNILNYIIYGY